MREADRGLTGLTDWGVMKQSRGKPCRPEAGTNLTGVGLGVSINGECGMEKEADVTLLPAPRINPNRYKLVSRVLLPAPRCFSLHVEIAFLSYRRSLQEAL